MILGCGIGISRSSPPYLPWVNEPGCAGAWVPGRGETIVGGAVSVLADQSGNGHDLIQANASYRPVPIASDANYGGKRTLNMSGGKFMQSAGWSRSVVETVYIVCNSDGSLDACACDSAGVGFRALYFPSSGPTVYVGSGLSVPSWIVNAQISRVYAFVVNGASSILSIGFDEATGNLGSVSDRIGFTIGSIVVGGSQPLNGTIAFAAAFSSAHDTAARHRVISWLSSEYGVPV